MALHRTPITRSDVVLGRISDRGRKIRVWFEMSDRFIGIWQSKAGKTYAVGHDRNGKVIVYRTSPPADNWSNGSNLGFGRN